MAKDNQYTQIIQLWKNERQTKELLEVKSVIYSTIRQKIASLEKDLAKLDKKDTISQKIIGERIERLNKILRDLTKLRMHKIIHCVLNNDINTNALAAEEIDFVKNLERNFTAHNQRSILGETNSEIFAEPTKTNASEGQEMMTIRILEDLPEIAATATKGEEKRTYGPFKKEDIVRLPLIYAKTLIMKNAADRVDLPDL